MKLKRIRVVVEVGEEGILFASSPDLVDLLVSSETIQDLKEHALLFAAEIYRMNGQDVVLSHVAEISSNDEFYLSVRPASAYDRTAAHGLRKTG